ncbi:MAG TPA: class I SAM-dependent methyltransferase [Verrucomicrobiae bacterium]|nr:class I SAM-dependent methyltransferase [Verrucomicrobiae bacterium]
MIEAKPSRTAYMVAMRRAAHQIFDNPKVLDDPIALPILGPDAKERILSEPRFLNRFGRAVRAAMAVRSRYAEDQLARALERGTRQYVILGAGLDTFAYRNPHAQTGLRVFEVDYPATQEWKRQRLAEAGIAIPASVIFAPVDFEHQTLPEGLRLAGFDASKPAFFSWLGVTMYLAKDTVMGTLRFVASCAPGGGVALDYMVPRETLNLAGRLVYDALSRRVAKAGEPFRTFFEPQELQAEVARIGFHGIENLGPGEINARYFKDRADGLRVPGLLGRFLSAEV